MSINDYAGACASYGIACIAALVASLDLSDWSVILVIVLTLVRLIADLPKACKVIRRWFR